MVAVKQRRRSRAIAELKYRNAEALGVVGEVELIRFKKRLVANG
jgi:hypothetical protein